MLSYPINFLYSIILTCRSWFGYMYYTIVSVHVSYDCIELYMYYTIANVYVLYDIIVYVHVYMKACACIACTLSLP